MSLIKCPECGQEISDQAKKCIHCGKELFHCPECGKTTVRHGNTCPQCGYVLPDAPKPVPAPAPAAKSQSNQAPAPQSDLLKAWETACPAEANRRKAFGVVNYIAKLAAGIPMILVLFHLIGLLYPVNKNTTLADFVACENFINDTFTAAIVLGCVAAVVASVVQFWRVIPIANWLKKGSFDTDFYLKTGDLQHFGKNADGYWAAYCALSPRGKLHWGIDSFAWGITALDEIFMCMGVRDLAIEHMKVLLQGSKYSLSVPWVPIVIVFALLVVGISISMIVGHSCKKFLKSYASKEK